MRDNGRADKCGNRIRFFDADAGSTVKLMQGPDGNIYQLTICLASHRSGCLSECFGQVTRSSKLYAARVTSARS